MELLDRYLHAVRPLLPQAQRDDIIAELSENILSHVEDKEAVLGRPLTEAELEAILKQIGPPFLVAGRYRNLPVQHLIGPVVFPYYWLVMQILLCIFVVPMLIASVGLLITGESRHRILPAIHQVLAVALPMFGWVTFEFAVLDICIARFRLLERWSAKWSPRSLPPIAKNTQSNLHRTSAHGFIAAIVFLLWWLAVPRFPFLIFGPFAAFLKFGPEWQSFYVSGLLLALAGMVQQGVNLVRPSWAWLRVATSLEAVVLLYFMLRCHPYVVDAHATLHSAGYAHLAEITNISIFYTLLFFALPRALIAGAIYAWQYAQHIRQLMVRRQDHTSSHLS
jgi:hypothetical protein